MELYNHKKDNSIYAEEPRKNVFIEVLGRLFVVVCLIISVFMVGFTIIYDSAPVNGVSMQPTLNKLGGTKSDIVYINKFAKVDYGDIVVVKRTEYNETTYLIKRLLGLPGDRINIKKDTDGIFVYRNGEKLVEDYILNIRMSGDPNNLGMQSTFADFENLRIADTGAVFNSEGELVLQDGQLFALGDNRGYSIDCADDGPFKLEELEGRVDYVVPYGENALVYFLEYFTGVQWLKD